MVSTPDHRGVARDCLSAQGGRTSVQGTALAKGLQDIGPSSGTTPKTRHSSGGSLEVLGTGERHHDGAPGGQPREMLKGALSPPWTGRSGRETPDQPPQAVLRALPQGGGNRACTHSPSPPRSCSRSPETGGLPFPPSQQLESLGTQLPRGHSERALPSSAFPQTKNNDAMAEPTRTAPEERVLGP